MANYYDNESILLSQRRTKNAVSILVRRCNNLLLIKAATYSPEKPFFIYLFCQLTTTAY